MTRFHNPYHFVPVFGDCGSNNGVNAEPFQAKEIPYITPPHAGHSRYQTADGIYNGRIVCKLTTETPMFVGAERNEGNSEEAGRAFPYMLDDEPAIPASSLRGMISSVAEAASHSALRVLEDRALSRRSQMTESLSALGMIFLKKDEAGNEKYLLQPIAMPTLAKKGEGYYLPPEYQKMFVEDAAYPRLKVYIKPRVVRIDEHGHHQEGPSSTFSAINKEYYYMNIRKDWKFKADGALDNPGWMSRNPWNTKHNKWNKNYIIGQRSYEKGEVPIRADAASSDLQKDGARGIIRSIGGENIENMPATKKHELFIPYPKIAPKKWEKYIIPYDVVENFYRLADERTDADKDLKLPYHPVGTQRNENVKRFNQKFRLKTGDIVYFRPDETGEKVDEISLSSIWRRGPLKAGKLTTTHAFFNKTEKNLLPYHEGRSKISPAELIFGFSEQRTDERKAVDTRQAVAYAGRVRFSAGRMQMGESEMAPFLPDEVPLKILDAPKPPSPALYFREKNGSPGYIGKSDLNPEDHCPKGRKFYLHKQKSDSEPWRTHIVHGPDARWQQKVRIKPLRGGLTFYFHIDFENLNDYELGMLCYALKPGDTFRHKIGMGKPLGLGSVNIEPMGLFYVDRAKRYCNDNPFDDGRYGKVAVSNEALSELPERYHMEKGCSSSERNGRKFKDHRTFFTDRMDTRIKKALMQIGDPNQVKYPVRYPFTRENRQEVELFEWFSENEKNGRQYLEPLPYQADEGIMPYLNTRPNTRRRT